MANSSGKRTYPCAAPGCERQAKGDTLCPGHRKRMQRGKPLPETLREYGLSGQERLAVIALRAADADGDAEYRRARDWLRIYAKRYSEQLRRKASRQPSDFVQKPPNTPSHG